MDLRAAAETSATSGWFEGWIGGLIAAAVTLGFTAWWETRQHRRRQLDDAVATLAAAQSKLWQALLRMAAHGWDTEEAADLVNAVASAQLRAGGLAARRVLNIRARFVSPSREGLRRTLGALDDAWSHEFGLRARQLPLKKAASPAAYESNLHEIMPLASACQAQIAACNAWLQNPWRYARGKDLSEWARSDEARTEPLI
ncbi:hypothetical protein DBB34_07975 [Sphaerisporangium cinnabarinum]|nr:hypothetical protein [Sphaerisporangium cinnabarinum]PTU56717.1 hypothetical protein DBB34_07975 [Sphaerisporangium cinnabarinum]